MMVYIIKMFRDSSFSPAEVKVGGDSFPYPTSKNEAQKAHQE